jgi:hypothetical protein
LEVCWRGWKLHLTILINAYLHIKYRGVREGGMVSHSIDDKGAIEKVIVSDLRRSASIVGRLYPVLLDKHGIVIDGKHRLKADPSWFKVKVQDVGSEEERLLARLVSNVCRRNVSAQEKNEMIDELGRVYLKQGVQRSKLVKKLVEKTGMSYRWIMKYASSDIKVRPGLGGPKTQKSIWSGTVAWRATGENEVLSEPSKRVATLTSYSNTNFATILVEKKFYLELKEIADELRISMDVIINNALLSTFQKAKELVRRNELPIMLAAK